MLRHKMGSGCQSLVFLKDRLEAIVLFLNLWTKETRWWVTQDSSRRENGRHNQFSFILILLLFLFFKEPLSYLTCLVQGFIVNNEILHYCVYTYIHVHNSQFCVSTSLQTILGAINTCVLLYLYFSAI